MNGFRVNKGIIIELTALLDVIMIMMFWLMMNVSENSEAIQAEADSRVAAAESQLQEERESADSQIEQIKAQAADQVAEAWQKAEEADSEAWQNKTALEDYRDGALVTMNLRYDSSGLLSITNGEGQLGSSGVGSSLEVYTGIITSLKEAGVENGDVVLCAFVYDGSVALYRDVQTVTKAIDDVAKTYKNFYCTYINTAR